MSHKKKIKNMSEKTLCHAGMPWRFGRISGRHTSWRIHEWNIFLAYDIQAFHSMLEVRCREPEQANSRLGYNAH
jgi:hypothetical protein